MKLIVSCTRWIRSWSRIRIENRGSRFSFWCCTIGLKRAKVGSGTIDSTTLRNSVPPVGDESMSVWTCISTAKWRWMGRANWAVVGYEPPGQAGDKRTAWLSPFGKTPSANTMTAWILWLASVSTDNTTPFWSWLNSTRTFSFNLNKKIVMTNAVSSGKRGGVTQNVRSDCLIGGHSNFLALRWSIVPAEPRDLACGGAAAGWLPLLLLLSSDLPRSTPVRWTSSYALEPDQKNTRYCTTVMATVRERKGYVGQVECRRWVESGRVQASLQRLVRLWTVAASLAG